ncbi:hypothetical protein [Chryseobacterium sp. Mn2064]|uniref:hypothetical protein n=1 Tax=Chryseobacterium sp. Mn2064 TaxID=3395263 RepID=UPI003BDE069B
MTEKFPAIESKANRPLTYFFLGMIWLAIIAILAVIGFVFENIYDHFRYYIKNDLVIFILFVLALLLLLFCCIALIMSVTFRKKQKPRRVIVDEKGATFYNNRNSIIETILYRDLQSAKNQSDDVYVYNTQSVRYPKTTLRIYLKDTKGEIIFTSVDFNFEMTILNNQYDLYRHFLKGVQQFRPDLKISQQTIDQYYLTSEPPKSTFGMFEYFMAAFFLLIISAVIYAFVIIIRSLL